MIKNSQRFSLKELLSENKDVEARDSYLPVMMILAFIGPLFLVFGGGASSLGLFFLGIVTGCAIFLNAPIFRLKEVTLAQENKEG